MKKEDLERKVEELQEEKLDRVIETLDSVNEQLKTIVITQAEQAADLKHHIYRTSLNEENLSLLREEFKPVEKHVERVNGVLKLVGLVATIVGMAAGIVKVFSFFS